MHDIPLPELGSLQYYVIQAGVHRERAEKVAFAKFLSNFLAPLAGVNQEKVVFWIAEYCEELQQLTYNYNYETVRTRITAAHQHAIARDRALLERVEKMGK